MDKEIEVGAQEGVPDGEVDHVGDEERDGHAAGEAETELVEHHYLWLFINWA